MIGILDVVRITLFISGIHACYSALEFISIRGRYGEGQLMDWRILRLDLRGSVVYSILAPFLRNFTYVLYGRLLVGALTAVAVAVDVVSIPLVGLLLFTDVLILLRNNGGLSGAYHMSLVVNTGILVTLLAPAGSHLELAGILFIAAQGILGYCVAGVAKLVGEQWRDGSALSLVLSTKTWGHPRVYEFIKRNPTVSLIGSWATISFETLFPIVLLLGSPEIFVVLGLATVLHVVVAFTMGIPTFMFIFPATYPPIYYTSLLV